MVRFFPNGRLSQMRRRSLNLSECPLLLWLRFAYIAFRDREGLEKALDLNDSEFDGQTLVVNEAGQPGGGGAGGGGNRGDPEKTVFVKGFDKSLDEDTVLLRIIDSESSCNLLDFIYPFCTAVGVSDT